MSGFMRSRICVFPVLAWMLCASCKQVSENGGAASEVQPAASVDHDVTQAQNEEPLPSLDELFTAAGVKRPPSREIVIVVAFLDGGEVWLRPAGGGLCRHRFEGEIDVGKVLYGRLRKPDKLSRTVSFWETRKSQASPLPTSQKPRPTHRASLHPDCGKPRRHIHLVNRVAA